MKDLTNDVNLIMRKNRKIVFNRILDLELIHKRLIDITLKADKSFLLNSKLYRGETFKYNDKHPTDGKLTCTVLPLVNGKYLKSNQ